MSTLIYLFCSFFNDIDRSSAVSYLLNHFSVYFILMCYNIFLTVLTGTVQCRQGFFDSDDILLIRQCLSTMHVCVNEK